MQHTAVHSPNHPTRLTDFEPDWMLKRHPISRARLQRELAQTFPDREAICLVLEDHGDRFSAGVSEDATSVSGLRGGHGGVTMEGLVILVSQSPAGRLWSRALISTNRFLIRASRALHPPPLPPRINTRVCAHMHKPNRSPISKPPLVLTRDNPLSFFLGIGLCITTKNIFSFRKMEFEV